MSLTASNSPHERSGGLSATTPSEGSVRHWITILVMITVGLSLGRMMTVTSREGDTAFLSANDRSRWCTISALVDDGTYAIDRQLSIKDGKRRPWYTIDLVRHRGQDGLQHYYSSKPPLLPTMIAGVYAIVQWFSGLSMIDHPKYVPRLILAIVNLPLLIMFLVATCATVVRICQTNWGKRFGVACVCFGTMLLPFSVALNNHLPAAACSAVVAWIYVRMWQLHRDAGAMAGNGSATGWGLLAGVLAGFCAANELPALSMLGLWGLLFLALNWRTIPGYVIGFVIVAVAFFATNWIAHHSLRPPYAHRGVGELVAEGLSFEQPARDGAVIEQTLKRNGLLSDGEAISIRPSAEKGRLTVKTERDQLFALVPVNLAESEPRTYQLRHWDDWYEYPGSYWQDGKRNGVDVGEPSRARYLFHMTVGHYGLFSLSPIWLLMPLGVVIGLTRPSIPRSLWISILVATLVCGGFYLARPEIDRNYGGVSICFRWLLWFAPLWLTASSPAFDLLARSPWLRSIGVLFLMISVFSVSTGITSPWQSPWIYQFADFLGWLGD